MAEAGAVAAHARAPRPLPAIASRAEALAVLCRTALANGFGRIAYC